MKGKRQWLGLRAWVADKNGNRRYGTLWFTNQSEVVIREDRRPGLVTLPRAEEGILWGFAQENDGNDAGC